MVKNSNFKWVMAFLIIFLSSGSYSDDEIDEHNKKYDSIMIELSQKAEEIEAPSAEGVYLVTKGLELTPLTISGKEMKYGIRGFTGIRLKAFNFPERLLEYSSRYEKNDDVIAGCIKQTDQIVKVAESQFLGLYYHGIEASYPTLAFGSDVANEHCGGVEVNTCQVMKATPDDEYDLHCEQSIVTDYDDFILTPVGRGYVYSKGDNRLILMNDSHKSGDFYKLKSVGKQWDTIIFGIE